MFNKTNYLFSQYKVTAIFFQSQNFKVFLIHLLNECLLQINIKHYK